MKSVQSQMSPISINPLRLSSFLTFILFGTCSLFLLGQFGRIPVLHPHVHLYAYEVGVVGYVTVSLLAYGLKPIVSMCLTLRALYFFIGYLFIAFIATSLGYTVDQNIIGLLYLLRLVLYALFIVFFSWHVQQHPSVVTSLRKGLFIGTGVILVTSFFQFFFFPDLRPLYHLGWDEHLYRMFGTFFEPAIACAVYGVVFYSLLFLWKDKTWRKMGLLSLVILAILLTFSRAGYVAFVASFALSLLIFNKQRQFLIASIIFVFTVGIFIVLLPSTRSEGLDLLRTNSIAARVQNYQEAIQVWKDNPVTGVGYNRIRYAKEGMGIATQTTEVVRNNAAASFHSSFLIVLVTGGIVGLCLFGILLYSLTRLSALSFLLTVFLSVFSLFDNILLHPFVVFLICVVVIEREKTLKPLHS